MDRDGVPANQQHLIDEAIATETNEDLEAHVIQILRDAAMSDVQHLVAGLSLGAGLTVLLLTGPCVFAFTL